MLKSKTHPQGGEVAVRVGNIEGVTVGELIECAMQQQGFRCREGRKWGTTDMSSYDYLRFTQNIKEADLIVRKDSAMIADGIGVPSEEHWVAAR